MKQCYPKNEFRLSDLNLIFLTWIIVNVTKSSLSSDTDLEDAPWCLVEIWRQKKENSNAKIDLILKKVKCEHS